MPNKLKIASAPHKDAQARVLRFLWRSRAEWSGREIARQAGLSAPACHQALKKLDARGLVLFRRVSNVHLYKINSDNYLVQQVYARQFEAEKEMPKQIETAIKKALVSQKPDIVSISLFGSFARKTHVLGGSDIDVLVVLPTKDEVKDLEACLVRLGDFLFKRFSMPLSPYVQSLSELRRKHHEQLPLIREILKDGRTIYGKDLHKLLNDR